MPPLVISKGICLLWTQCFFRQSVLQGLQGRQVKLREENVLSKLMNQVVYARKGVSVQFSVQSDCLRVIYALSDFPVRSNNYNSCMPLRTDCFNDIVLVWCDNLLSNKISVSFVVL